AEGQRKRRLIAIGAQARVQLREHVFVRRAPGAYERRVFEVRQVDDFVETIAQEEGLHVIEVRLAAVDEARTISLAPQAIGQRKEPALRRRQLEHGLRRRGQE